MTYSVKISPTAFIQINEAVKFVSNVSYEAATKLYHEIMEAANSLKEMSLRYPKVDFLKIPSGEVHKTTLSNGRYAFLFIVSKDVVNIDLFTDLRQKNNSILL